MTETGAGGAGFLVASAFTGTNCAPCGFCTPAAMGEKRPKLARASHSRKAATLTIESLAAESLDRNRDKDILQRGNLFLLCTGGNLGRQLRPAKPVRTWRSWALGMASALIESSRRLQIIALGETVGNRTGLARDGLAASKTMRSGGLGRLPRMASGLHEERAGGECKPSSQW